MSPRLHTIVKKLSYTKKGHRWYWVRIAPNGEKLERSQMYKTRGGRNKSVNKILERERVNVKNE